MLGDLMLGKAADPTPFKNRIMHDGYADLIPLCESTWLDKETLCKTPLQLVFEG